MLQELDVRNNPELEMPPKPVPDDLGSGPEFYNVDFTLQTQLRMATGAPPPPLRKYSKLSQDQFQPVCIAIFRIRMITD